MFKKLIGNREFYKRIMAITIPILIQNVITHFVSLIDNIMVGQVGTEQMSGVAIVNQLIFVFNLAIFGGTAGAGIFTAQYFGKNDHKGVRDTFRVKVIIVSAITIFTALLFYFFCEPLISLFLHEGEEGLNHIEEYSDGTTERGKAFRKAICEKMHFDSLEYQTLEGMMKAIGIEPCKLCTYCWNGKEK